eukprot:1142617-Pelagomonas_calceolata.AAC.4
MGKGYIAVPAYKGSLKGFPGILADRLLKLSQPASKIETMVTMGVDLQPSRLADRLVAGLCQPKKNP